MSPYPVRWHQTSHGYGDDGQPIRQRESFVFITENGAIEGWRTPEYGQAKYHPSGYYGGIEVHSKSPKYSGHEPHPGQCQWTGGVCYHDGSSLAFERIEWAFDNPAYIFGELAEWANSHLGGAS